MAEMNANNIEAIAQTLSNLSIVPPLKKKRSNLLLLARKKDELKYFVTLLKSDRKYISRDQRDLMVQALLFLQWRNDIDLSSVITVLRASTRHRITKEIRHSLSALLDELLVRYTSEFDNACPENDKERFDAMIEENGITQDAWEDMKEMKVVLCHVLPFTRKMEVVGQKTKEAFFSDVTSQWKFENPSAYFLYTGGATIPVGKLDRADAYVTAGTTLDWIGR